jgi:hypothetical protein
LKQQIHIQQKIFESTNSNPAKDFKARFQIRQKILKQHILTKQKILKQEIHVQQKILN